MNEKSLAREIEIEDPYDFLSAKEKEEFLRARKEKAYDRPGAKTYDAYDRAGAATYDAYDSGRDNYQELYEETEDVSYDTADLRDLIEEEEEVRRERRRKKKDEVKKDFVRGERSSAKEVRSAVKRRDRVEQERGRTKTKRVKNEPVARRREAKVIHAEEEAGALLKAADKVVVIISRILLVAIVIVALYSAFQGVKLVKDGVSSGGGEDTQGEDSGTVAEGERVVTTADLRLRTAPNTTDSTVVVTVTKGTELSRIAEENGWSTVNYEGQTLYCATQYLEAAP